MKITHLESFPPNSNPYHHDAYHMGMTIGKNVTVMMANHSDQECGYLIVINKTTGERLKITFDEKQEDKGDFMSALMKGEIWDFGK